MAVKRARIWAAVFFMALIAVRAAASGGPPPQPDYITAFALHPADREALADGRVGVVKGGAPAPILYLSWRLLNRLESGRQATDALATPCCGERNDSSFDWLEARRAVPGANDAIYYVATERPGPNYTSIPTCFGDAFATAIATLNDRIARHGARSPWVKTWLDNQDAVFAACSKEGITLQELDANAPAWARADFEYQRAALAFYNGRFDEAEKDFAAISSNRGSPWQPLALYLQARTIQRAALVRRDARSFARAHAAIARLEAAPTGTYGRGQVTKMRQILEYREHPADLLARLDRELGAKSPTTDIAVKFKDYWSLAQATTNKPEATDWIATIQAKDREAGLEHARRRWRDTHHSAWLVAALTLANADDPGADALAGAAGQIGPGDPAWLTAQYHWLRLNRDRVATGILRGRADTVLARPDLSLSDRNIFLGVRTQLATSLADFARHALREPYCDSEGDGCVDGNWPAGDGLLGRRGTGFVGFGGDARAVIDRLPLADRLALGRDSAIPRELKLDLALTNYVRAVLLRNDAAVDETARVLADLLPQVRGDWERIARTAPGPDKRFAEIFVMAKIPSLRTDLANYERPEGREPSFGGYWVAWMTPALGTRPEPADFPPAPAYMPERSWYGSDGGGPDDGSDLLCAGKCGQGRFPFRVPEFITPRLAAARDERRYFHTHLVSATGELRGTWLWDEALAYVTAKPRDPRAGETLYRLIRVARWGGNHDQLGRRAFRLLHARYPKSVWAKRSPYWYD